MFYKTLNQRLAGRTKLHGRAALFGLIAGLGMLAAAPGAYADAWTLTTLHTFTKTDGAQLYGALVQDTDGNLYGTTYSGGAHDKGTVYKITLDGTVTVLHSFDGTDGANPEAGLVLGDDGSFYGTTSQGGASDMPEGTVFKIIPTGTLTTLHSFCSIIDNGICTDGQNPVAALMLGDDGNLYGTAFSGGANFNGTVFKITTAGDFTLLYAFPFGNSGHPVGALVEDSGGNFYGTTQKGGLDLFGTVYQLSATGEHTILHSFTGDADGSSPDAGLLLASDGNLYGSTAGGANGYGTLFKITTSGTLTTLYTFDGNDVDDVAGALIEGSDGNFYGTSVNGGEHSAGDIFQMTPDGTLTVLHSFNLVAGEGTNPRGALLEAADGIFYGTTFGGGVGGINPDTAFGTVYKLSTGSATPPPAPKSLRAVADDGAIDLSWAAADGAASYNVYQGTSAGGEGASPVKTGITHTHTTIGGLTNGTTYYFTVAAVNGSGTGAHSNEAHATPLGAPGKVTGLSASAGDGSVKLSWTAVSGATSYTVNQGTAAGEEEPVATGVSGTNYTVSGLDNGTKYYFTVVATNSAGSGPASAEVSATPSAEPPPPPPPPPPSNNGSGGGGAFSPVLLLLLGLLIPVLGRRLRRLRCAPANRSGPADSA